MRFAKHIVLGVSWVVCQQLCAQQQWMYTLNQFNPFESFSAMAGSYGEISVSARHRQQWMGVEGAPTSSQLAVHGPWDQAGWGIQLRSESTGARRMDLIRATGAYRLKLKSSELSFALNAGLLRYQLDVEGLNVQDNTDLAFSNGNLHGAIPVVDFSAALRAEHVLFAVQANHINQPIIGWIASSTGKQVMQLDALVAADIHLSDKIELRPSLSTRYISAAPMSWDLVALLRWNEILWLGGGYRSEGMALGIVQWQVNDMMRIGYALDVATVNQLSRPLSHELFLGINVAASDRTGPSMRHF
mgnify:CR=1 FL=1